MKKSSAAILALVTFILGVVTGLFWAAYQGPPPGLDRPTAGMPAGMPRGEAQQNPQAMAEIQTKLAAVQERIKKEPGQVQLYVEAGNLLFDHDLHEDALKYYRQALEIGGENADILTDAGISLRHLGQSGQAVEYFRRARKVDPKHENSALNLGIVLFHDLKDPQAALVAWREYLALNPQGPRADMIRRVVAQIEAERK